MLVMFYDVSSYPVVFTEGAVGSGHRESIFPTVLAMGNQGQGCELSGPQAYDGCEV